MPPLKKRTRKPFHQLTNPIENVSPILSPLQARGDRPLQMTLEDQLNASRTSGGGEHQPVTARTQIPVSAGGGVLARGQLQESFSVSHLVGRLLLRLDPDPLPGGAGFGLRLRNRRRRQRGLGRGGKGENNREKGAISDGFRGWRHAPPGSAEVKRRAAGHSPEPG